jgi:SCY1-like protein 2
MAFSDSKLGMTKEIMATKVLPFLFPLSIENGLTVNQVS